MAAIADEMEAVVARTLDVARLSALNKDFHETILEAARNRTLRQSAERLMALGFLVHTYTRFTGVDIARSLTDHRNVLAAIASRDPSWANAAMRSHILGASNVLRARLAEDEDGDEDG
jgi:DNA-binding GntR family transcriptional regulator